MSVSIASPVQSTVLWNARSALQQRYQTLLQGDPGDSHEWLLAQLQRAETLPDDLPANPADLGRWSKQRAADVARRYADYLSTRKAGGPRRYFSNRAHALYFLQQVAPTKTVDGAWLQGTLRHWPDPRFHGLIRTYLEELGDGDPASNHVLIYRRLLSEQGCHQDMPLSEEHYLQGTVQLALGLNTEAFLPEVIGYNLGYEQLPLHLLITAYELDELGIDPHYFRLHVTIDNASSGHACKALQALRLLWPQQGGTPFYQRVARGYRLNDLGPGAQAIIDSFDLEAELLATLERKREFGQHMHSDYCRIEGRTVNQWLAQTNLLSGFFAVLQRKGWIRRDRDPTQSRFWHLIDGPGAAMFGVFDPYEKQLLHDWIAGTWQPLAKPPRMPALNVEPVVDDEQQQALEVTLQDLPPQARIEQLIKDMGGNRHALPCGLWATRRFAQMTGLHR
ncbi:iron-containing redox enzyme family protein [Pseudomonas sp. NPDC090755]|uniref:iron-containing redox enzyme family protein n=1 Tax=Pseudomonas sp. NPDC090755 TaxID=3364481 RepID=UPI00383A4467